MATTSETNLSILFDYYEHYLNFNKILNNIVSKLKTGLFKALIIPLTIILFIVLLALSPILYIAALYITYKANKVLETLISQIPALPTFELIELQKTLVVFDDINESDINHINNSTYLLEIVFKPFESLFISLFLKGIKLKKIIDSQVSEDLLLFEKSMSENTFIGA